MNRDLQQFEREVEREYHGSAAFLGTTPSLSPSALQRIRAAVFQEATIGIRHRPGLWLGRSGFAACVALALIAPLWTSRHYYSGTLVASVVEAEPAGVSDWLDAAIESSERLTLMQKHYSSGDSIDSISGEESLQDSLESLEDSFDLLEGVFGA